MKILSILQIIICMLLLQGCVAATIIGGTTALGAKAIVDTRSIGTQIDDSILELRIHRILSNSEQIRKKSRINATVYRGKTLLTGQVSVPWLIFHVKKLVAGIDGVTEIYNEIRRSKPVDFNTILSDSWITAKVRFFLFRNSQVKSSNVKIITENSEVFLLGSVTEYEGRVLKDIISHISGVKCVTTVFTYIK